MVEWGNSTSHFTLTLPADYSFIAGYNKIELEDSFTFNLQQHSYKNGSKETNFLSKYIKKADGNIYEYATQENLFNELSSIQYLNKKGNKYTYITDLEHPIETFTNLISTQKIDSDIILKVNQRKYNFKFEEYNCKLQDLIDLLLKQECTPYVGIESIDDDNISAMLVMVNHTYNYNHLLFFTLDRKTLSTLSGTASVEVSTYIPTHNVTELFDDNSQTNSKHNIKL